MSKCIQIEWNAADLEEAKKVALLLLSQRLIACANILPEVYSLFSWNGAIEESREVKVLFKTKESLFSAVSEIILQNTRYEVPEILKIEIADGHPPYLDWVNTTCV